MRRITLATLLFTAFSLVPATARAGSLTINLDYVFSGATPNSTGTFLTATFLDGADCVGGACLTDTVQLILTASLEGAGEFVTEWDFNSSVLPLSITQNTGDAATILQSSNAFKADGDGNYDLSFVFSSSPPRMEGTDTATFTITGTGITVATFDQLSFGSGGSGGPFRSAAHIQGIANSTGGGTCSGWVGDSASNTNGNGQTGSCGNGTNPPSVPDGGTTLTLLGLALGGIGAVRRYMNI
jgi:hypothetical protein